MAGIRTSPVMSKAVQNALKNVKAVDSGWFYNDPEFREAETTLRGNYGQALATVRQRINAAGITDPDAVARIEMPVRLYFAKQFRSLYNAQAAREQERREQRKQQRKTFASRLLGTILSIGTRGLVQGLLNRQEYFHKSSLNAQKYGLPRQTTSRTASLVQPFYTGPEEEAGVEL
jgi:hypothetical protein